MKNEKREVTEVTGYIKTGRPIGGLPKRKENGMFKRNMIMVLAKIGVKR